MRRHCLSSFRYYLAEYLAFIMQYLYSVPFHEKNRLAAIDIIILHSTVVL